jgi:hypothetical protein
MNNLAYALIYLDPGTGSLIIQLIIAAVTAAIFFVKSIRERITYYLKQLQDKYFRKK